MKQSINQTIFLITFILLLPSKNILLGGSQSVSKQKAWANFKPLIDEKETKGVLNVAEMDSTVKKYYDNCKKRAELEYPGKFEVYEITKTNSKVSLDTQYAVVVKSVNLSPRVDGKIIYSENISWGYPVSDELSFIDANLNVLWKKQLVWHKKVYQGVAVDKITKNGNMLAWLPDTSEKTFDRGEYPGVYTVFNKIGVVIHKYCSGGSTREPNITDNGKYFYVGESITYTDKEIWTVYDLEKGDSLKITRTIGKEGPPHIFDDGRICISSQNKLKWFTYDSLKALQSGKQK